MGRICYSLKDVDKGYCIFLSSLRPEDAVEIRLDACELDEEDIQEIFSTRYRAQLIATCHISLPSQAEDAARKLTAAILAGADYVDIPLDFPERSRLWLTSLAMNKGTRVIVSFHNHTDTEPLPRLEQIARQALQEGADIIKIVTTARSAEDAATVMKLYDIFNPENLLAFAMGPLGRDTRFLAFEKGAPFLFVSPTREGATAPGQPAWFELQPGREVKLRGEVHVPASKSFAQRAIVLAALASGTTKLYGLTLSDDISAAMGVARSLGADVSQEGSIMTITGHQDILRNGLTVKDNTFHVGESALLARICIPLAGLAREEILITGEKTLLHRKVDDHRAALRKLGLRLKFTDRSYLPVRVGGLIHTGDVEVTGECGSQMISGMLIALSQCEAMSSIRIDGVTSEPYIELTRYIASFFGLSGYVCPELEEKPDEDERIRTWYIHPSQQITPVIGLEVERDWSAAAMLLAAGAIAGDLSFPGLDLNSRQSDAVIYSLLKENQADLWWEAERKLVRVRKSILRPFFFDINDAPDLFAPLFLLAAFTEGNSVLAGIGRLRNKESDRAATFAAEFSKLGIRTVLDGDSMVVYGQENRVLKAAEVSSHGDHRLAMALMVASVLTDNPIVIDDIDCVTKSFPDFPLLLDKLKRH